jgi:hypothetical protein
METRFHGDRPVTLSQDTGHYIRGRSAKNSFETRVEAGSNTSTVTLRVVGGDEKGSLKSETVKYGHGSEMTLTRERLRWRGPAAYTRDTPAFSSEKAPQENQTINVKV